MEQFKRFTTQKIAIVDYNTQSNIEIQIIIVD